MPIPATTDPIPRAGFGKRVHAWLLARCGGRYERMVAERKRALFANLSGDILEIGPGAGPNLGYYPTDCRWIGVEPNPFMHPYLCQAAERAGLRIEIRTLVAEELPAENQSMDAVVSTLVLCSVNDPAQVLREVHRVLKPGGRFVFLEHVAAPDGTRLRKVQRIIRPVWKYIADGCCPDRETGLAIERAGFADVRYEQFRLPLGPVGTQIAGWAVK
ncbi:MAG: class I SAM-dependent methyltransferase [Acidobacteria bacterium]|nr:class I SAM-dependent methyltransferase [Acidobacteriota bacterium]